MLETGRKQIQPSHKKTVRQAWAQLLNVPEGDLAALLRRLSEVARLPVQIREQVLRHAAVENTAYTKHLPKIEKSFAGLHLHGRWEDFINQFDDTTMYGLEVCDQYLSTFQPDISVELEEIQGEVRELLRDVEGGELPDDLRRYLVTQLRDLDSALEEYRFSDEESIVRSIDVAIGTIVRQPKVWVIFQETNAGKRLWKIMARLALIIGMVGGLTEIGERIVTFLPISDEKHVVEVGDDEKTAPRNSLGTAETPKRIKPNNENK